MNIVFFNVKKYEECFAFSVWGYFFKLLDEEAGLEGIDGGQQKIGGGVGGGIVVIKEDGGVRVVEPKLGDEGEAIDFEIRGEGSGQDGGGSGEAQAFFVVEVFGTEGEAQPMCGIEVEVEGRAPPGPGVSIFFDGQAGVVHGAVDAKAEEGTGFGGEGEIVLVGFVVLHVAAAYIIEIEFQVIVGSIAVLGDQLHVALTAGGNAPVIGGIGDADHQAVLARAEICLDTGMGEGAVGKEI